MYLVKPDTREIGPAGLRLSQQGAQVWLRLHNNLTCGIRIPTAGHIEVTLPNGEKTVELLPDNARVAVIYQTQDYKRKKAATAAPEFSGIHVIGWPILPPGKSVSFGVPVDYFKRKLNIAVAFVNTWEGFRPSHWFIRSISLTMRCPKKPKNERAQVQA